jgi:hypothetical protein
MLRTTLGALALAVCALTACSSSDEDDELPLVDASRARELPFLSIPKVARRTRQSYINERQTAAQALPVAREAYLRATLGRLGYFAPDFDLRAAFGEQASWVGAFYDASAKQMTLFENPSPETVVHELVHALQDQHFDLRGFDDAATSTDEALARRALVEGDATLAELRYGLTRRGRQPLEELPSQLSPERAFEMAEKIIERSGGPAFFSAYPAFAYFYGGGYAARVAGVATASPFWSYDSVDTLFRERAPLSTQEVLRRGIDVDPIVDVGLTRLPPGIVDRYDVETVDRLGEWYTYLLLRNAPGYAVEAAKLASAWDGDQLLVLQERDTRIPKEPEGPPVALIWTTAWDDEDAAEAFRHQLARVQGINETGLLPSRENETGLPPYRAADGEMVWLEAHQDRVVFVKNLDPDDMRAIANAALGTPEDAERFPIHRSFALPTGPTCVP